MFAKRNTIAAVLVVLMSAMSALADLSINNPVQGTQWVAGEEAVITWIPAGDGFDPEATVTIELVKDNGDGVFSRTVVLGTAQETDGRLTFTVPTELADGSDYAVRIGERYSHVFEISGGDGSAPTDSEPEPTDSEPTPTSSGASSQASTPSASSSSTSTSTNTPISMPDNAATNMQPLVVAGSLLALVPAAVMALWGF